MQNTDVLLNIFKNCISHKTQKFDYKIPDWMNKSITLSLAHGWDKISIRMIQLCGKTIAIPLKMIFQSI